MTKSDVLGEQCGGPSVGPAAGNQRGMDRESIEAADVYSTALRLVALCGMYPNGAMRRAIVMVRDQVVNASDEDASALHTVASMMERRAWPEEWQAAINRDLVATATSPEAASTGEG